jgi:2-dehydro-3-deoxy-D-arabinonate dehydratase
MSNPYKLFRLPNGPYLERNDESGYLNSGWDELFREKDLYSFLGSVELTTGEANTKNCLAPIDGQEVWACGVTYHSSRLARMEESKDAGGGDFYARVYSAARPEIFFKATAARVSGPRQPVRIRQDSTWDVPEPELTLVLSSFGDIVGYTIGNDMSSRSIEGENPLYLPQAKTYEQCAGLGPCILVSPTPLSPETAIELSISRNGDVVFHGSCKLSDMKRTPEELRSYLTRELEFPNGAFVMTGTGIVPGNDFTLEPGDEVSITIEPIGTLVNSVIRK